MRTKSSHPKYTRRKILQVAGLFAGAAIVPPLLHSLKTLGVSPASLLHTLKTSRYILNAANAKNVQAMKVLPLPNLQGSAKLHWFTLKIGYRELNRYLICFSQEGWREKAFF